MNGAASTITTGNAVAAASSQVAARRATVTRGEDNSTTGSSVMAHIAHSDTMSTLSSIAANAGSSKGARKAISAKRRAGSRGHSVSRDRRHARARHERRDHDRRRDVAGDAEQEPKSRSRRTRERRLMRHHRIGERREVLPHQPRDMRREQERADGDRHPRRRRTEILPSARIGQRRDAEPREQEDRPVLAHHGGRRRGAGERRPEHAARLVGAQEEPGDDRPERDQHRVGVVFQRMEIEERNEGEQQQAGDALLAFEIAFGHTPRDPQREGREHHREHVVGPVLLAERS